MKELEEALGNLIDDVRKINNSPSPNIGIDRLSNPIEERLRLAEAALSRATSEPNEKDAGQTEANTLDQVDHSPLPWTFTYFTKPDGSDILTPQDVADTTAFSAMRCKGSTLWGVTLDEKDEEGRTVVVCYTGNGPHSEDNARLIVAAVNALNITQPVPRAQQAPTLSRATKDAPTHILAGETHTAGGWISVDERLPAENGEYLVMCEVGVDAVDYFLDSMSWESIRSYGACSETHTRHGVTHWMALPSPPKEGQ